ncbi:MAG: hypothetical protein KAH17_00990 [Bacteroidales bacterium]|nr:hypothetical protein [Bacteroidales bacterium]
MKIIRFILLLLSVSLLSCESEPDIMNDDAPPALFVWGYVDMQSGHHKVRIRRAIQEEGNMYELAQDPKLLLPADPIRVNLIIYSLEDDKNPTIIEMHPVVYPKEEGNFSSEQNIIHEVEYPIPEFSSCQVQIHNLASGEITSSGKVSAWAPGFLYPRKYGWYEPTFYFNNLEEPFHVHFKVYHDLVQKLVTEIKYVDVLENGDTICQKQIFEGQAIFGAGAFEDYIRAFPIEYIFNILNRVIPEDPQVKFRWFYRFNFKALAADHGLRTYIQLAERHSDNRKLYFSNIIGGYGLFYACNFSETGDIEPTWSFADTLWESPATENLKFSKYMYQGTYIDPDTANMQVLFKTFHHE